MSSTRAKRIHTVAGARRSARRALPLTLFDYIDGGADGELTMAENERAFQELALRPRMGIDVGEPSLVTTVLGTQLSLPVLLAPCGMVQLVHPDGAIGVARAAARAGTIAMLSKIALCPPAEVAARSPGPHWYQVNAAGGREEVKRLMAMAADAGFTALVLTIDGPPPGNHERDLRHGVVPPVRVTTRFATGLAAQALIRPRWTGAMVSTARRQMSTIRGATQVLSSGGLHTSSRFTWADIEWIRAEWTGSLLVKGVLTGADAVAAREAGADAIVVSNHGGRALDSSPATLRALPEIVAAVGSSAEILMDGGVRRATDVVKALCLGARAVLIGRPVLYGLATAGQPGVERIIEIFRVELLRTMKLLGCRSLADLDASRLQRIDATQPTGADAGSVVS